VDPVGVVGQLPDVHNMILAGGVAASYNNRTGMFTHLTLATGNMLQMCRHVMFNEKLFLCAGEVMYAPTTAGIACVNRQFDGARVENVAGRDLPTVLIEWSGARVIDLKGCNDTILVLTFCCVFVVDSAGGGVRNVVPTGQIEIGPEVPLMLVGKRQIDLVYNEPQRGENSPPLPTGVRGPALVVTYDMAPAHLWVEDHWVEIPFYDPVRVSVNWPAVVVHTSTSETVSMCLCDRQHDPKVLSARAVNFIVPSPNECLLWTGTHWWREAICEYFMAEE
jgi:hypothetical protein